MDSAILQNLIEIFYPRGRDYWYRGTVFETLNGKVSLSGCVVLYDGKKSDLQD